MIGLGLVVGLILSIGLPAGSFTSAQLVRAPDIDIVADENGIVGLDVVASVSPVGQDRLVNVTNNYDDDGLQVTVSLRDGSDGTLYADGSSGDSVTFSLDNGETVGVDIDVQGNPETVVFDVTAIIDGINISAPGRETDVQPGGGGGPS